MGLGSVLGLASKFILPTMETAEPPGFRDSGNVNDKVTKPTMFDRVDEKLGTNIGKFGQGIAGGLITDWRQRRNTNKQHDDLKKRGLTSFEIAGGGSSGGQNVGATGNTLGSGPSQQVKSQQDFTARENQKNRDNAYEIAKLSSVDRRSQMDINRPVAASQTLLNRNRSVEVGENVRKLQIAIERADFELKNFWNIRMSQMGADNVMVAIAMAMSNMDFEQILTSAGVKTPEDRRKMQRVFSDLASKDAWLNKEVKGAIDLIRTGLGGRAPEYLSDQRPNSLGNNKDSQANDIRRGKKAFGKAFGR